VGHVKRSCGPSESSATRHSHRTPLSSVDVSFFKSPDGGFGWRAPSGGDYLNKFEASLVPARESQLFPHDQEGVSYLPTTCKIESTMYPPLESAIHPPPTTEAVGPLGSRSLSHFVFWSIFFSSKTLACQNDF
jgi:hypothetical protein